MREWGKLQDDTHQGEESQGSTLSLGFLLKSCLLLGPD